MNERERSPGMTDMTDGSSKREWRHEDDACITCHASQVIAHLSGDEQVGLQGTGPMRRNLNWLPLQYIHGVIWDNVTR